MNYDKEQILKAARLIMGTCSVIILDKDSYVHKRMARDFSEDEMHKMASWMTVFRSWLKPEGEIEFLNRLAIESNGSFYDSLQIIPVVKKGESELRSSNKELVIP